MRYLGSKTSLLPGIYSTVCDIYPNGTFCDPFGGIGTVGAYFKSKCFRVVTGDILKFAHCFQVARIVCNNIPEFENLCSFINTINIEKHINDLSPMDGWFVEEYSKKRLFFTENNARKIQSCIDFIWNLFYENIITETEYCFLIASLINSMDSVANTAGTYYAYLKTVNRKASKSFIYRFISPIQSNLQCSSTLSDALQLVKKTKYDILYLDPPYNERDYQKYYHLPENIADRCIPKPLSNLSGIHLTNSTTSDFNNKKRALQSFIDLIENSTYKCLVFHYSDNGLISQEHIRECLGKYGHIDEFFFDCRAYATTQKTKEVRHHLYRVIV